MKQILVIAIMFGITLYSFGQKEDLVKYLDAYKTSEFEESKKIIKDYSFNKGADYILSEYGAVSGLSFETDIPEVKGYKAIIPCKVQSKAGAMVEKRMLAVLYFDKKLKHWSVYGFREVADTKSEYDAVKTDVDAGKFYTKKEFVYRSLAYWSMMNGLVNEAQKNIDLAITEAKNQNNASFTTDLPDIITSITK